MTAFKTILLRMGREQRAKRQLAAGVELASRFGAHLIGLAVLPATLVLPTSGGDQETVVNGWHRAAFREEADRMKRAFLQASLGQGFTSEWILEDAGEANSGVLAIEYAYPVDLIIAGPVELTEQGADRVTERLVFESGRPVLVLPRVGGSRPIGGRVLVAWNGSREATKAAFDALPLLQTAQYVKVLVIGEGGQGNGHGQPSAERLCNSLARHDVHARSEMISLPGAEIGPALLSAVKAESADLLVMGCLGYPEFYEFTLGEASRHVLRESPVPVLMSH
jgi:nucleotide-binding universal stress UspA family protein